MNDLHRAIDNDNCQVIQYADDTFLYSSHTNENIARSYLEKNIEKLCFYFQSHQLMMNNKKTEYIVFAPSKKARTPSYLNVNDVNIGESSSVKISRNNIRQQIKLQRRDQKNTLQNGVQHQNLERYRELFSYKN